MNNPTLSVLDYLIVVAMLAISAGIGVFFTVRSGRKQSSNDYFLGDRQMSVIPVSLSLAATVMSAITYLGTPAEVYVHGPQYGLMFFVRTYVPFFVAFCFVPVFYRLKVTTIYEYLELRFNNTVRFLVIAVTCIKNFIYMGIVVYTPALALSTAAGINLTFSILSIGIICTFYTSFGGIKAVIWTDVFQAISMLLGAAVMIVVGTIKVGGVKESWRRSVEGGHGDLVDFNIDPTVRLTVWSIIIGGSVQWTVVGTTKQSLVQRYNSCATEKDAKLAACLGIVGMGIIELLAVLTGMTAFAYYHDCDPLTSGKISRSDQIVPYFMMDLFHSYPGVPGILIGGAFAASLSSMSSVLNGLAATTGQDVIKTMWPNISETKYTVLVKVVSVVYGISTIFLAFLASVLGDVLQTTVSIGGILGGTCLGVFMLGMFVPRANSAGATVGLIAGSLIGIIKYIGARIFPPATHPLPVSITGCNTTGAVDYLENVTDTTYISGMTTSSRDIRIPYTEDSHPFFQLSYMYMSLLTAGSCFLLGLIVSYITSRKKHTITDPKYLAPIVARYYTKGRVTSSNNNNPIYKKQDYVSLEKVETLPTKIL